MIPAILPSLITANKHLNLIVVAAQLHRLEKETTDSGEKVEISRESEPAHLYTIAKGEKKLKQLTDGLDNDLAPQFSKAMNGLLFVRNSSKNETNELMFLATSHSKPTRLGKLPVGAFAHSAISTSGQTFVAQLQENDWDEENTTLACVFNGQIVKTFAGVDGCQIIPGTETIAVHTRAGANIWFNGLTNRQDQLFPTKEPVTWLNSGIALSFGPRMDDYPVITMYNKSGKKLRTLKPVWDEDQMLETFVVLPQADTSKSQSVIVEDVHHMSSGHWPSCFQLDLQTGVRKRLFRGHWLDTNDLREFLSLDWEWIGAYHRGNDRTGLLMRSSPKGQREVQVTRFPYRVTSACWAPSSIR